MGKTKKKSGKEKDKVGDGEGDVTLEIPKLVLKVGKEKKPKEEGTIRGDDEHSHHKKKKKKHKHKTEEVVDKKAKKREHSESHEVEATPKKVQIRVTKEKEEKKPVKELPVSALDLCLENLHRNLQRKDVYGIFTFPVTDLIAPGYSKIIKTPMDFLTMSKKIGDSEYTSLDQFREDFVVMCNNAMTYNGSDTIYYKSAEKMLQLGIKMLSKDKILKLNRSIGKRASESDEDDDVTIDDSSDVNIDSIFLDESNGYSPPRKSSKRESRHASLTASILASAKKARERLMKKQPNQLYGYLGKDAVGEHVLNILNPDTCEDEKQVGVTIGKIAGLPKTGVLTSDQDIKEDKKNKVVPVNYLLYGPYGTFGPTYDSSLSNTNKEESDILLHTYGSEGGVEYVKSITKFAKDAMFARDYVDGIIDALTNGAHRKLKEEQSSVDKKIDTAAPTEEKNNAPVANTQTVDKPKELQSNVDIHSLLTLDGVGIDVTFLKNMVKPETTEPVSDDGPPMLTPSPEVMKAKLAQNADMLHMLKQSQNSRLSSKYGGTNPIPSGEIKVATSITDNLKDIMGMVTPKDVVSSEGVRKAIGSGNLSMHTVDTTEKSNEVTMEEQVPQDNQTNSNAGDVPMETS